MLCVVVGATPNAACRMDSQLPLWSDGLQILCVLLGETPNSVCHGWMDSRGCASWWERLQMLCVEWTPNCYCGWMDFPIVIVVGWTTNSVRCGWMDFKFCASWSERLQMLCAVVGWIPN